ncbi:MAG: WhiB family transcriptional regulator [Egibacteraceae bacterium]
MTDWRPKAACLDINTELFFPVGSTGVAALDQAERAKQVCAICPVKAICLQWALTTRQHYGVWGGLDEQERRNLRRARARQRAARERRRAGQ